MERASRHMPWRQVGGVGWSFRPLICSLRTYSGVAEGKGRTRWTAEAQRKFLVQLERKRGIEKMEDWKEVSVADVVREGGSGMLRHHACFFDALASNLKDREEKWGAWSVWRARPVVPPGYWEDASNRKVFVEHLKRKLGVRDERDWRKVTVEDMREEGGRRLLSRYDRKGGQVLQLLRDVYPDAKWEATVCRPAVPPAYWKEEENLRRFVRQVEARCGVTEPADWYRLAWRQIIEAGEGGRTLKGSFGLLDVLRAVYPDYPWDEKRLTTGKRASQAWLGSRVKELFSALGAT